jgi:signal transduction histidine kinase/tetratricopeptide (TPR) repeat protein
MAKSVKLLFRPQLYKRVLVFVLTPLLLFTGLLFMLRQVFVDEQRCLEAEIEQSEIIAELGNIVVDAAQANTRVLSYGLSKTERKALVNKETLEQWVSQLDALRTRYRAHPKGAERLSKLLFEDDGIFQVGNAESGSVPELNLSPQLVKKIYRLISEIDECVNIQWSDLKQIRAQTDKKRRLEELVLYGGFATDLLISPVLIILFSRRVIERLRILVRNASKIGKESGSIEPLESENELAYLNKLLLISHGKLLESNMLHRLLREMVAHDVRSPLQSALVNVQLIEERVPEISDQAFFALDSAYKNMDALLSFVSTLLEMDRNNGESENENKYLSNDLEQADLSRAEERHDERQAAGLHLRGLSLVHKGVLLVLLPLALQSGILVYINNQMDSTQKAIEMSRRLNGIFMDLQIARIKLAGGGATSGAHAYTKSTDYLLSAEKSFSELDAAIKDAALLAGTDHELTELVNQAERVFGRQKDIARSLRTANSNEEIKNTLIKLAELQAPLPEAQGLRGKLSTMSSAASQQAARLHETEMRSSQKLSGILAWGTRVNFGLTIALLIWFTYDVRRRLRTLVRNASNLACSEAVFEEVSGNDELSYLNSVIVNTRRRLETAAARRGEMTASLAREMYNTLLGAKDSVLSFAEIESGRLPPAARTSVTRICANIDRTVAVITSLRSLGEIEPCVLDLDSQTCDVKILVGEALEALTDLARLRDIVLENKCESCKLECDKLRITQVLINYIANSIKFSPKSSSIIVCCKKEDGDRVRISVCDRGTGLSNEVKERIFDRFFQASSDARRQGYGLGLAICKSIVESHSGELGVEDRDGGGSIFWFSLPEKHVAADAESVQPESEKPLLEVEQPFGDGALAALFIGLSAFMVLGTPDRQFVAKGHNRAQMASVAPKPEASEASAELLDLMKSRWTEAVKNNPSAFSKKLDNFMQTCRGERKLFICYVIEASLFAEKDKERAFKWYEKAAESSSFDGKETVLTGKCYAMMALCHGPLERNLSSGPQHSAGDYSEAKELALRALRILDQPWHNPGIPKEYLKELQNYLPSTANTRYVVYDLLGRISQIAGAENSLEESSGYFARARAIALSELAVLPQVCSTTQLACILNKQGRHDEVGKLMACVENEMLSKAESPLSRVLILCNIADSCAALGDYRKSKAFYEKALLATDSLSSDREMYRKNVMDCLACQQKNQAGHGLAPLKLKP